MPGLARGDSVVLESDFTPLAHPDNNNLGNVYKITVIADPKHTVNELNENDNSKDAPVGCVTADSDIVTGITGTQHPGQSFNETRAVDVTVISSTDRIMESLTLEGLNAGANAQVGARIYDGTTQMLTASSDVSVSAGSDITVTIPLTASLVSGRSYRIGFYVQTNPQWQASGNLFQPDSIPYTETAGIFRINSAHSIGSDSFPSNPNIFVPKINIRTRCQQVQTVVSTTGKVWMDRNLGASQVATSPTDSAAYGDLYQWGRGTDGHQLRTSGTTSTLSSTDDPGHGDFILSTSDPYDWRSPQNDNLWQGVGGTNNPCPAGFRLPTDTELDTERASWSSQDSAGAFGSPLKLPVPGYHSVPSGAFYEVDSAGAYWSSTVNGDVSRSLYIREFSQVGTTARAYALSVRCIQE